MEYVDKDKVFKEFNELLPWEKVDFVNDALYDIGEDGIAEHIFGINGGHSPFDFITEKDCIEHFGANNLLYEIEDYELEDYISSYPRCVSAYTFIKALKAQWDAAKTTFISETNIKQIEELLEDIKKYKKENE